MSELRWRRWGQWRFGREDCAVFVCKRSTPARCYQSIPHHLDSNSKCACRILTATCPLFLVLPFRRLSRLASWNRMFFGFSFSESFSSLRSTSGLCARTKVLVLIHARSMQTQNIITKCIFSLPPNLSKLLQYLHPLFSTIITTNGLSWTTTPRSPRLYQWFNTKSWIIDGQPQCFADRESNTAWPTACICVNSIHATTVLPATIYVLTTTTTLLLSATTFGLLSTSNSTPIFTLSHPTTTFSTSPIFLQGF